MSVSGVSPRPHASSFSACSATSRRAASHAHVGTTSSMATCSTTNYNSILLGQCNVKPEPQLTFYQAKKLKDTTEALQAKVCVLIHDQLSCFKPYAIKLLSICIEFGKPSTIL